MSWQPHGKNLGTARTEEEKFVLAEKKQEREQLAGFATWSENQSAVLQTSLMKKQQLLNTAWKKEMMYCLNITELIFFFIQPSPDQQQQPYMFVPSFKAVDRELLRISQAQTSSTKK